MVRDGKGTELAKEMGEWQGGIRGGGGSRRGNGGCQGGVRDR